VDRDDTKWHSIALATTDGLKLELGGSAPIQQRAIFTFAEPIKVIAGVAVSFMFDGPGFDMQRAYKPSIDGAQGRVRVGRMSHVVAPFTFYTGPCGGRGALDLTSSAGIFNGTFIYEEAL
jgi:hypothetical protein